jgi:hypothetical protein
VPSSRLAHQGDDELNTIPENCQWCNRPCCDGSRFGRLPTPSKRFRRCTSTVRTSCGQAKQKRFECKFPTTQDFPGTHPREHPRRESHVLQGRKRLRDEECGSGGQMMALWLTLNEIWRSKIETPAQRIVGHDLLLEEAA